MLLGEMLEEIIHLPFPARGRRHGEGRGGRPETQSLDRPHYGDRFLILETMQNHCFEFA